jgi:peroxiredoxin (alkyl hydroperoxide reductase subunit C)
MKIYAIVAGSLVFGWALGNSAAAVPLGQTEVKVEIVPSLGARVPTLPLIGDRAPSFAATTTAGTIRFPDDYAGSWVVLFSHPADFTPVCTSEFVVFGSLAQEFGRLNTKLLGLSINGVERHLEWFQAIADHVVFRGIDLERIPFPVIADHDQEVAWRLGMLHPRASSTETVRAVYVVDPTGVLRAMLYYPKEVGRSVAEIKRLLIALQTVDSKKVVTPAEWMPGDDVLALPSAKDQQAGSKKASLAERSKADGCQTWFFCLKKLPKSELAL